MQPYEVYVKSFNIAFIELLKIAPTKDSVNDLQSEEDELEFIIKINFSSWTFWLYAVSDECYNTNGGAMGLFLTKEFKQFQG